MTNCTCSQWSEWKVRGEELYIQVWSSVNRYGLQHCNSYPLLNNEMHTSVYQLCIHFQQSRQLQAFLGVPVTVACVFWALQVAEHRELYTGGGGTTAFHCIPLYFSYYHPGNSPICQTSSYLKNRITSLLGLCFIHVELTQSWHALHRFPWFIHIPSKDHTLPRRLGPNMVHSHPALPVRLSNDLSALQTLYHPVNIIKQMPKTINWLS